MVTSVMTNVMPVRGLPCTDESGYRQLTTARCRHRANIGLEVELFDADRVWALWDGRIRRRERLAKTRRGLLVRDQLSKYRI
jgi:hypothetical protein